MTNGKLPWFPFFPGDWLSDPALRACSPSTRGIWIDILCAMHKDGRQGKITSDAQGFIRLTGCSEAEWDAAVREMSVNCPAIVRQNSAMRHGEVTRTVTLINRRMYREAQERKANADRKMRERERKRTDRSRQSRGSGHGPVTPASRYRGQRSEVRGHKDPNQKQQAAAAEATQVQAPDAGQPAAAARGHWVVPEGRTDMPFHLTTEQQDAWGEAWYVALGRKKPWGALTVQQREKLNHFARWVQQHYPDEVPFDLFERVAKLVEASDLKHHGRIDLAFRSDELLDSWIQQAIHGEAEPETDYDRYRRAAEKASAT